MSDRACDLCGEQGHSLDFRDGYLWVCALCSDFMDITDDDPCNQGEPE